MTAISVAGKGTLNAKSASSWQRKQTWMADIARSSRLAFFGPGEILFRPSSSYGFDSDFHKYCPPTKQTTMASRGFTKTLRAVSKQKLPSQSFQRRSLSTAISARPAAATVAKATFASPIQQQTRGVKTIDFAGHKEQVFGAFCSHLQDLLTYTI